MEEELDDCDCKWYCSCRVLLKGKRTFPPYLELPEYQDLIRGPPPKRSTTTGRRFSSKELGGGQNDVELESGDPAGLGSHSASGTISIDSLQAQKSGLCQTENDLNTVESKPTKTLVNGHPTRSIGPIGTNGTLSETTSAPKKTTNGIGTTNSSSLVSATETKNKTNARIDKESDQNAKSNNLPVTNGGGEGNIIPPRRSGYNCRDREKFHKCSICKKMFGQKASLLMHEKEHVLESAKPHACNYCDKLYSTVASYERHLKTRHPKCILCRNILTMKQIENQPEEEIGINQVNLCTKCRKKENDAPIVKRRHSQTSVTELNGKNPTTTNGFEHGQTSEVFSGDNGISTVNGNGEHFANNGNVLPDGTNQLGDGDETILFCDYCGAMFDCSEDFLPHYHEHGKHEFECRYCLLPFNNSDEVCRHERSHDQERPWNCLFCPIKFRSQTEREFHERFHT